MEMVGGMVNSVDALATFPQTTSPSLKKSAMKIALLWVCIFHTHLHSFPFPRVELHIHICVYIHIYIHIHIHIYINSSEATT